MKKTTVTACFDKFKPESCVFVNSIDKNGKATGMIAGWNMKISGNPFLFAVSLAKNSYTLSLILESKEFVIAVPNKELEEAVRLFGSTHGNEIDKFKEAAIQTEKAAFIRTPLIKNASINFECRLYKEVEAGDHHILIGEILASYLHPDKKILLNM